MKNDTRGEPGIPLLQVDAFAQAAFRGNPAAVCLLDGERSAEWMGAVAAEMNLSETAFLVGAGDSFGLRWFTPTVEVPLCGHATLAAAHAVWEWQGGDAPLTFDTLSGPLRATRSGDWIALDLPAKLGAEAPVPEAIAAAVGGTPRNHVYADGFHLVELDDEAAVRNLHPDLAPLLELGEIGLVVTSGAGGEFDFVSRVFAPGLGIDEDPVTGAAHCMLAPYWSARLGRSELVGFQASARGGVVRTTFAGVDSGRVRLEGQAVTVLRGELAGAARL